VTSHGLVLLFVSSNPEGTIREIAESLGLTERRVNDIIRDLVAEGLVEVRREGRRNHYTLSQDARFRHPFIEEISFRSFVSLWKVSRSIHARNGADLVSEL
jgi:predicted transcriptional regulator